jgi:mRNA degradation ribonuclease J1/J2
VTALAPRAALPVHGRRESLESCADVSRRSGIPGGRVFVLENGDSLFVGEDFHVVRGARPVPVVSLDTGAALAIDDDVLRDRRQLAAAGVVAVSVALATRSVIGVTLRGVAAPPGAGLEIAREVESALCRGPEAADPEWIRQESMLAAKRVCRRRYGVRPLIVPILVPENGRSHVTID